MILPASLSFTLLNAASNALNQATDVEADRISKPYRPIPCGIVTSYEAMIISGILYLLTLLVALFINPMFCLFITIIIIFTVTYSLPPRFKQYLFLNQVWIAIPRGILGILAAWSVFENPFQLTPITIGTIATIYLFGSITSKDILDSEADKRTGTRTLINTFGTRNAALISFPFMFFPFTFIPIMVNQEILSSYFWPLTFFLIPSCLIFYLMVKKSESKMLENVHAWSIMYIEYIFFSIGFSLLIIIGEINKYLA